MVKGLFASMVALGISCSAQAQSPQNITRETPYSGRTLDGSVFLCKSDKRGRGRIPQGPEQRENSTGIGTYSRAERDYLARHASRGSS